MGYRLVFEKANLGFSFSYFVSFFLCSLYRQYERLRETYTISVAKKKKKVM